jgi:hypothetical protein
VAYSAESKGSAEAILVGLWWPCLKLEKFLVGLGQADVRCRGVPFELELPLWGMAGLEARARPGAAAGIRMQFQGCDAVGRPEAQGQLNQRPIIHHYDGCCQEKYQHHPQSTRSHLTYGPAEVNHHYGTSKECAIKPKTGNRGSRVSCCQEEQQQQ